MARITGTGNPLRTRWIRSGPLRSPWHQWPDRFLGSDPGLNRLRMALRSVLTIAAVIGAEWLFVHGTHALLLPAGAAGLSAAEIDAQHHEVLVIAMVLGAIFGQITAFGVNDPDARGQLLSVLTVPVPLIATIAFGLAVNGHRVLSLTLLAVLIGVGTYLRRFGGRGFLAGIAVFVGFLIGYFLRGAASTSDIGWLAAEIGVGVLGALLVRFGLFYPPDPGSAAHSALLPGPRPKGRPPDPGRTGAP
jgi:hypothetical protein